MKKILFFAPMLLSFLLGYLANVLMPKRLISEVLLSNTFLGNLYIYKGFDEVANKTLIPCQSITNNYNKVIIALVFGQSNSANHGFGIYKSKEAVFNLNFYDNKCYRAEDPLLGATGNSGSVWTRFGDKIIHKANYDAVIIIPIGVTGTSVKQWAKGGILNPRISEAIKSAEINNLKITHVLWHQGESDADNFHNNGSILTKGMSSEEYEKYMRTIIQTVRENKVTAPFYISIASRCGTRPVDIDIQKAQINLVNPNKNIYQGPNTDSISDDYRYDGCHFNEEGLDRFAELFSDIVN